MRALIAFILMLPVLAHAQNVFTSTSHEAHDLTEARNLCNMKANLFVQAFGDRNAGIASDVEIRRLRAATERTRLDPSDIDDLVQMAYTSKQPAWQVQPAIMQACMAPFNAGFEYSQRPAASDQ